SMRLASTVLLPEIASFQAARSIRPAGSTGRWSTGTAVRRESWAQVARTASCSAAQVRMPPELSARAGMRPLRATLMLSVAPLVKTTSVGEALIKRATWVRASSIRSAASQPKGWSLLWGLPYPSAANRRMTSATRSSHRVVALLSMYTITVKCAIWDRHAPPGVALHPPGTMALPWYQGDWIGLTGLVGVLLDLSLAQQEPPRPVGVRDHRGLVAQAALANLRLEPLIGGLPSNVVGTQEAPQHVCRLDHFLGEVVEPTAEEIRHPAHPEARHDRREPVLELAHVSRHRGFQESLEVG